MLGHLNGQQIKIYHLHQQIMVVYVLIREIPVIFNGEEKVIGKGLLLKALVSEVELYGESDEFPENIQYNVGDLDFGAKVFAKDLEIPEGFKLEIPENTLVATMGARDSAAEEEEEKTTETSEN